MPIYEYRCPRCLHVFDIFVRKVDDSSPQCPKCGGKDTKKIISPLGYLKHPDEGGQNKLPSGNTGCSDGGCQK